MFSSFWIDHTIIRCPQIKLLTSIVHINEGIIWIKTRKTSSHIICYIKIPIRFWRQLKRTIVFNFLAGFWGFELRRAAFFHKAFDQQLMGMPLTGSRAMTAHCHGKRNCAHLSMQIACRVRETVAFTWAKKKSDLYCRAELQRVVRCEISTPSKTPPACSSVKH